MAEAAVSDAWRSLDAYGLESPELVAPGLGPEEPASPGERPESGSPLPDGAQVNALTVLTLLEKLASMLDSVQQKQQRMAQWQTGMANSVTKIQGNMSRLSKDHNSTSNMVSKLMDRSLHLSANMKEARHHAMVRSGQVDRLEDNHLQIMRSSPFRVLLFKEEEEIPPNLFVKKPEPPTDAQEEKGETSDEKTKLGEIWHTVDLSSDEERARTEECLDDSGDEKSGESRAKKIKCSSRMKVDNLKKAFTRQNIEKTMNRLVPPERREKIKKSLSPSLRKKRSPSSVSKDQDPTDNEKNIPEGKDSALQEERLEVVLDASNLEKTSLKEEPIPGAEDLEEASLPMENGTPEEAKRNIRITVGNTRISMGEDGNTADVSEEEIQLDSE